MAEVSKDKVTLATLDVCPWRCMEKAAQKECNTASMHPCSRFFIIP